jgi:hypothetical protein
VVERQFLEFEAVARNLGVLGRGLGGGFGGEQDGTGVADVRGEEVVSEKQAENGCAYKRKNIREFSAVK